MPKVTTLEHVLSVLGVQQTPVAEQGYLAAEDMVGSLCRWYRDGNPDIDPPDALVQSVILRTARYISRRESPNGVAGVGEFGPVRISSVDRDVEELEAPWRRVVFG